MVLWPKATSTLFFPVLTLCLCAAPSASVGQNIDVLPGGGHPLQVVTLDATSFGLRETVDISFDTRTLLSIKTDAQGGLADIRLTIPPDAFPGCVRHLAAL